MPVDGSKRGIIRPSSGLPLFVGVALVTIFGCANYSTMVRLTTEGSTDRFDEEDLDTAVLISDEVAQHFGMKTHPSRRGTDALEGEIYLAEYSLMRGEIGTLTVYFTVTVARDRSMLFYSFLVVAASSETEQVQLMRREVITRAEDRLPGRKIDVQSARNMGACAP